MTVENYIAQTVALGIDRGALESGMPPSNPHSPSPIGENQLLDGARGISMRPELPQGEDLSHLCNTKHQGVVRGWWARLSPEQRKAEAAKRRENGRGSRKL